MVPELLQTEDAKKPRERFHARELKRLCGLVWPYRKELIIGTLLTIVFAGLNTVSIGGVFPVIAILLEPEGLHGWSYRSIAAQRLGVELAPPLDPTRVRVVKVAGDGAAAAGGIGAGDELQDPQQRPIRELLREIALYPAGGPPVPIGVTIPEPRQVAVSPGALDWKMTFARWAITRLPAESVQGNLTTLTRLLITLVALVVIANVFRYFGEVYIARAVLRSMMGLRATLYERTLALPIGYHLAQPTSDLVTRFVQDIHEIQRGLLTLFGRCIREPLRAVLILGLAFTVDWRLTLAMLVVAPAAVAIFWAVGRSVKKANRKLLQRLGMMLGTLTNSLQNIRVVKAHLAEAQERRRLTEIDERMLTQQVRIAKLEAATGPVIESLAIIAGSVLVIWLAARVLDHSLSRSEFLGIGIVLSVLFDPLRKLSDVYVKVLRSTAGAERIFQIIDRPGEKELATGTTELATLTERIDFADVTFTYPGAAAPALRDVDLTIHQGETIAIVGPNGSGKTTLVNLLPRFFDPGIGQIRFDGIGLTSATLPSLRRQFSLVSQESVVFGGTPMENIAYGDPEPDLERVKTAAARAYAADFISALPGGFAASLGERGTTLSGGQRQRLAIARAIYRNAPILIFDEATSQVDSESELAIHKALRDFAVGRTTIIIAHRLSTIQFAQRIVVMDGGRIIDQGPHQDLVNRCPLYRTLCETQLGGAG